LNLLFAAFLAVVPLAGHADDPRLEIPEVNDCFETAKRFLRSAEYSGEKNREALVGACRDVDSLCISEAGESLHPSDPLTTADMVKILRACRGRGMGKCLAALKGSTQSHNRREVVEVLALLKKCE
jgi:hypothetical protein